MQDLIKHTYVGFAIINYFMYYLADYRIYRKSGNFHVEIIHVVNIQCWFIFVGLWYPRKYFNMNLLQHEHLAITIVHIAHEY